MSATVIGSYVGSRAKAKVDPVSPLPNEDGDSAAGLLRTATRSPDQERLTDCQEPNRK